MPPKSFPRRRSCRANFAFRFICRGQMNFFVLRLPTRGICPFAPGDAPPKLGELSRALKDSREACKNKFLPLHILFEVRKMARKILRGAGGLLDFAAGAIFFCAADCAGESGVGEFLALLVLPLCRRKKGYRRALQKICPSRAQPAGSAILCTLRGGTEKRRPLRVEMR